MINSTFKPQQILELGNQNCKLKTRSVSDSCPVSTTKTLDYKVLDDSILMGLQFLTKNSLFGDSLTISVIDIDNVLGLGANFVVATPINSWVMSGQDGCQFDSQLLYPPNTIPANFYLRAAYTSTAGVLGVAVNFAVNYKLHEVLF